MAIFIPENILDGGFDGSGFGVELGGEIGSAGEAGDGGDRLGVAEHVAVDGGAAELEHSGCR